MDLIAPNNVLLVVQLTSLVYLGFWVYALIDCVRNEFRGQHQKLIWVILILFAPVIGTFLYLSMGRRTRERRRFSPDFNKEVEL